MLFFKSFLKFLFHFSAFESKVKVADHSLTIPELAGSDNTLDVESIHAYRYGNLEVFKRCLVAIYFPVICLFIINHSIYQNGVVEHRKNAIR